MKRHPQPVLTYTDVPFPATLVFNAGVVKHQGRYVMIFRNDHGRWGDPKFDGTNLGLAFSRDGLKWEVEPQPIWSEDDVRTALREAGFYAANRDLKKEIRRAYDPRLTVIEGRVYMAFALDTAHGVLGGIATTDDFHRFRILSISTPDNRNMVLFPEKIGGKFVRLERPFPIYGRGKPEAFEIWHSDSPDLRYWGNTQLVLGSDEVPYANSKIGPAAPPVKTPQGWLATIHAVIKDDSKRLLGWEPYGWHKTYCAGLMLLDLEKPWIVKGLCPQPLLYPETPAELDGFRGSVIFPGGMILEDSGEVRIYYGAADSVVCMASAPVEELVAACLQK